MRQSLVGLSVVIVVSVAAIGVAHAIGNAGDPSAPLGTVSSLSDLAIFRDGGAPPTAASRGELSAVSEAAKKVGSGSIAAAADVNLARPIDIPGTDAHAWLAPSGTDMICLFIPTPNGYNTGCSDIATVGRTGLVSVSRWGPKADDGMAIVVEPDGAPSPKLIDADGSARSVQMSQNVAVTKIAGNQKITTGPLTMAGPPATVGPGS